MYKHQEATSLSIWYTKIP